MNLTVSGLGETFWGVLFRWEVHSHKVSEIVCSKHARHARGEKKLIEQTVPPKTNQTYMSGRR